MTPEERAEMRRHEKALTEEILAVKRAESAVMNAMTFEERMAYHKKNADEFRALGFNVVS
jgi:cystathionine beta-lyase/cystathionine gamma-synthase